jgi:hypothetical protein
MYMKIFALVAAIQLQFIMLVAGAPLAKTGEIRITGKVVDVENGTPLPGAVVSAAASDNSDTCGSVGSFEISLPATPCSLVVSKTGYEQKNIIVKPESETMTLEVQLAKSTLSDLPEMTVVADRSKRAINVSEKISLVAMKPEFATQLPGTGQADLFRTMQLLPGVTGTNELSSGIYIRGGTPDQNLILLDYVPIYYVDHFYGFYSAFNPRAIDNVNMYKGGFGPQWGGRLSGVVELTSKGNVTTSNSERLEAAAGIGLLSSDFMLKVPIGNNKIGTVMLAGRRAMTDLIQTDLFSRIFNRIHGAESTTSSSAAGMMTTRGPVGPDTFTYVPDFYFWDLNGCATLKLGSHGRLSTTVFSSYDNQTNAIDTAWERLPIINYGWCEDSLCTQWVNGIDSLVTASTLKNNSKIVWGNRCLGQQWEQVWSDAFTTRLSLYYSSFYDRKTENNIRTDRRTHHYSDVTRPLLDSLYKKETHMTSNNSITDISSRFDNIVEITDHNTLYTGIELSRKQVIYERDTTPPDTNSLDWKNWYYGYGRPGNPHIESSDLSVSWAVYAEDEIRFGDIASIAPGIRLYRFQNVESFKADPRLSGWWKPIPEVRLKAGYGIYTQEIHRVEEEDIVGGSSHIWLLTNRKRPFARSQQLIAGVAWEKPHFLIDAEGYYKQLNGLLTISERMRSYWEIKQYPFEPDEVALFEGCGTAKGIDLLIQLKNCGFPLFNKELLYDGWLAYTLSRTENQFKVFNNGNPFPASNDHTHELKLVNSVDVKLADWSHLNFGAVWIYATGAPYTAPIGSYTINLINDTLWSSTFFRISDKNVYRLPDYHRLDVSLSWKILIGSRVRANFIIGVFNAYNHKNVLERTYTESDISGVNVSESWVDFMESETILYTAVNRVTMKVMPNAAFDVTVTF